MIDVFSIDGKSYKVLVLKLDRKASVLDGEKAGRTMDAKMHRDIKGTFYNYSVSLGTKDLSVEQYDELYEVITSPVDYHNVILPYGQGKLTFDAYIANAEDTLGLMKKGFNLWRELTFTFTAMEPQRRPRGV